MEQAFLDLRNRPEYGCREAGPARRIAAAGALGLRSARSLLRPGLEALRLDRSCAARRSICTRARFPSGDHEVLTSDRCHPLIGTPSLPISGSSLDSAEREVSEVRDIGVSSSIQPAGRIKFALVPTSITDRDRMQPRQLVESTVPQFLLCQSKADDDVLTAKAVPKRIRRPLSAARVRANLRSRRVPLRHDKHLARAPPLSLRPQVGTGSGGACGPSCERRRKGCCSTLQVNDWFI